MLEERDHRAKDHRHQSGGRDDDEPFRRARQNRPHARHQEDARLHHGGRVQIGRHGRRRGHRMRQPEMERELRRLGKTAEQDQDQRGHIERIGLDQFTVLKDHAEVIAAYDLAQDQHAADHRKPAHTGDGKRHARALASLGQVFPIADQQEGRQRCQLPEDQQKQDVVGHDDPHHRALKQQQIGKELAHVIVAAEVVPRIGDDQQSDAQDQESEKETQPVQHQREIQSQSRHPVDARHHDLARKDGGQICQQAHESHQRNGESDACAGRTPGGIHQTRQQSPEEWQQNDNEQ